MKLASRVRKSGIEADGVVSTANTRNLRAEVAEQQQALTQRHVQQRLERFGSVARRRLDRPVPDFLIIGAAKAGTSSLFATLQQHPEIAPSLVKETDFFSHDAFYDLGLQWYRSLFCDESARQLVGEASTSYSRLPYYPETADRVFNANPNVKIIFVAREPVARTYSHMLHRWQREIFPDRPFDVDPLEYLRADPMPVVSSLYEYQLEPWRKRFSSAQLCVISFEELAKNPASTLAEVYRFLRIETGWNLELSNDNATIEFQSTRRANAIVESWKATRMGSVLARAMPKRYRQFMYDRLAYPCGWLFTRTRASVPRLTPLLRAQIAGLIGEHLAAGST